MQSKETEKNQEPMTCYVGINSVYARVMSRQEYCDLRGWELPANENGADRGYLVEHLDGKEPSIEPFEGYVTWCPEAIFKGSYRSVEGLNFGLALEHVKLGGRVARSGWNGSDQYISLVSGESVAGVLLTPGSTTTVSDFIVLKNAQDKLYCGWVPSVGDLLAEDWQMV